MISQNTCAPPHHRIETWVVRNSSWLALGVIAAAFAVRVAYSDSCYLNPDEAQHFEAARQSSWLATYKASLALAHPPLFILVLHGILVLFGRTELILTLPSVVGGTAALWLTFAWMRRSLGGTPALAGLGFMAVSPAAISASTEVRQYGLLLCFVCGSLYATERTFSERSTIWAIVQGLFLLGALLTHYIAIVVLVALGLYVSLRSFLDDMPRRILFTIGVSQLVLAMVEGWLYFGYVHRAMSFKLDYLRYYYYAKAHETLLGFARRALSETFLYVRGPTIFISVHVGLLGWACRPAGRPNQSTTPHGALGHISVRSGVRRRRLSSVPLRRFPAPDLSAALPRSGIFGRFCLSAAWDGGAAVDARSPHRTILGHPRLAGQ